MDLVRPEDSSAVSNVVAAVLLVGLTFVGSAISFPYMQQLFSSQSVSARLVIAAQAVSSSGTIVLAEIYNTGNVPASITKVEVAGESQLSHNCPNPLKPGMSCKANGVVSYRQPGEVMTIRAAATYGDNKPVSAQREVIVA